MREHEKFVKQEPSRSIHHTSVTQTESKIGPTKIISALGSGGGGGIRNQRRKAYFLPHSPVGIKEETASE